MAARTVTVQAVIADIRVQSGLRNNQLFDDDQIAELATDAQSELGDLFINAYEHYFQTTFPFTIASPNSSVALPADFQKDNSLNRNPNSQTPETVDPLGSWLERNQLGGSAWTGGCRRYFISGDELQIFPASQAPGDYLLFYTPQLLGLSPVVLPGYLHYSRAVSFGTSDTYVKPTYTIAAADFQPFDAGASMTVSCSSPNTTLNGSFVVASVVNPTTATISSGPTFSPTLPIHGTATIADPSVTDPMTGSVRALSFASGGFDQSFVGASVTIAGAGASGNDGVWIVASVPDEFHLVVSDPDNAMQFESAFPSTAVISIQRQGTTNTIPQSMVPWVQYIKTHASITIRTSRKQPTDDLQAKLQALKTRVATSVKNRTEAPRQAPLTRHVRYAYGLRGY